MERLVQFKSRKLRNNIIYVCVCWIKSNYKMYLLFFCYDELMKAISSTCNVDYYFDSRQSGNSNFELNIWQSIRLACPWGLAPRLLCLLWNSTIVACSRVLCLERMLRSQTSPDMDDNTSTQLCRRLAQLCAACCTSICKMLAMTFELLFDSSVEICYSNKIKVCKPKNKPGVSAQPGCIVAV